MPQLSRDTRTHRSAPQARFTRTSLVVCANLVRTLHTIVPAVHSRGSQPMIPAIPTGGSNNGRRRVPAGVADNSLPCPGAAIVVVAIGVALVGCGAGVHGGRLYVYLGAWGTVEVPNVYAAIVRARVDVSLICGGWGGEVASDEGLQDAVAAEGHERTVVRVGCVVEHVVRSKAVVEVCGVVLWLIVSTERLQGVPRHIPVDLPSHQHRSKPSFANPKAYTSGPWRY
jgi:hypothetical protein